MNDEQHPLERLARRSEPRGADAVLRSAQGSAARRRQVTRLSAATAAFVVLGIIGAWLLVPDDDGGSAVRTADAPQETTSTTVATTTTTTATTTTTTAGTTPTTAAPDGDLPGERIETFPLEGLEAAVVAVAADDTLNVRATPGADGEVVAQLDPLTTGVIPTGHNRLVPDNGIWAEVDVDGVSGWVRAAYLGHLGRTTDATAELYPGDTNRPSAATTQELVARVVEELTSRSPDMTVTVVSIPTDDRPEFTVDVTGAQDDSGIGIRYHFRIELDSGQMAISTVEGTALCRRGVTEDGICL